MSRSDLNCMLPSTVNEPWEYTPLDTLKDFYWDCYQIVQRDVPHWITVFHDSFRLKFDVWGKFMVNCPNYAIDTHIYQAWFEAAKPEFFQEQACAAGAGLRLFEDAGVPIVRLNIAIFFDQMFYFKSLLDSLHFF